MALYRYVKSAPVQIRPRRRTLRVTSYMSMGLGAALLLWVAWPILSFSSFGEQAFSGIITPINDKQAVVRANPITQVAYAAPLEFSNVNAWYPAAPQKHLSSQVNTYELSVPNLKIQNALVTISGDDLDDTLVHYGGTGLPGQYGTAVVFGHSTLPQFYSPTNYKSIFSLLPTLKKGDDILVTFDGVDYRYTIYDMVVKDPNDLSVLEQQFDDSYLSLVTCVPPGTTWKRLHVLAKLNSL
jgi:sortase A